MRRLLAKVVRAWRKGEFRTTLRTWATSRAHRWRSALTPAGPEKVVLHCPEYVDPPEDPDELRLVSRIFESYRRMSVDRPTVADVYLPSSMWQKLIREEYASLIEGSESNDLARFHFFLRNFGTWKSYHGIESTTFVRNNMKSLVGRRYLRNVFRRQLRVWRWFYGGRKTVDELTYPAHGNQCGAFVDGAFVGIGSSFNEIYGSILEGLLGDRARPVVAELGAGYGKLAYFILRRRERFAFVDFDLPETLCLAAYYLMKCWPEKKAALYGEATYSAGLHSRFDLIFMPSWEIARVEDESIDLFVNKNSLGEMTREAASNYVRQVARSTRYFFHMNHDITPNVYDDRQRGLLGHEYPVPPDTFQLLLRYPDLGHLLGQGHLDFGMDIFQYLYERKQP